MSSPNDPVAFDEQTAQRLVRQLRRHELEVPATGVAPASRVPPALIDRWVRVTTTTPTDGRFAGFWLQPEDIGDNPLVWEDQSDIWVRFPNDETPALDTRYKAQLNGLHTDGKAVYVAVATSGGTAAGNDFNAYRHIGPVGGYPAPTGGARYYTQALTNAEILAGPIQTGAVSNRLIAVPYISVRAGTLDRIAVSVTTPGGAARRVRLAIYEATSGTDLYPAGLIVDSGEIDVSTAGLKEITINVDLEADTLYWFAINSNASGASANFYAMRGNCHFPILGWNPANASIDYAWALSHAYGSHPDPFPSSAFSTFDSIMPLIAVRYVP